MAVLAPLEDAALDLELAQLQPDLRRQFSVAGVTVLVQSHIVKANVCSAEKFQVFAFSAEGVLVTCKRLGLDSEKSIENYGLVPSVVLA